MPAAGGWRLSALLARALIRLVGTLCALAVLLATAPIGALAAPHVAATPTGHLASKKTGKTTGKRGVKSGKRHRRASSVSKRDKPTKSTGNSAAAKPQTRKHSAKPRQASGSVIVIAPSYSSFALRTGGRRMRVIDALTEAANTTNAADYPYVYGGGHGQAGVPSIGVVGKGKGADGKNVGYDCSGSVAAVLAGAGLWPLGAVVPADNGIISQLLSEHLIAPGRGKGRAEMTLYDDPGVHIFINIDGRYFGTSDGAGGAPTAKGGAGWLSDGAPAVSNHAFKAFHVLSAVLEGTTTYGQVESFVSTPSLIGAVQVGDDLNVSYLEDSSGQLTAQSVSWVGAGTASGTIIAIAQDQSSFSLETVGGQSATFSVGQNTGIADDLQVGDSAEITYVPNGSSRVARVIDVTAEPTDAQATGTITAIASDESSFTIETAGGQSMAFSTDGDTDVIDGFDVGDVVQVSDVELPGDLLIAQDVESYEPQGATDSAAGTITGISSDESSFTIETAGGQSMAFSTGGDTDVIDGFEVGDSVQVSYTEDASSQMTAQDVEPS